MTRDAREVERKKVGLHKARRGHAVLEALSTFMRTGTRELGIWGIV